jgi:hypothetical protein
VTFYRLFKVDETFCLNNPLCHSPFSAMEEFPIVASTQVFRECNKWVEIRNEEEPVGEQGRLHHWFWMDTKNHWSPKLGGGVNCDSLERCQDIVALPSENWGMFNVVGVRVLASAAVTGWGRQTKGHDDFFFRGIGDFLKVHDFSKTKRYTYCIPGKWDDVQQLTLVRRNLLHHTTEVYFLEAKSDVERGSRSRLPGMGWFYARKDFEAFFRGVCW